MTVAENSTSCATSPDGIIWASRPLPTAKFWRGLTHDGTRFVVGNAVGSLFYTSVDGVVWEEATSLATSGIYFAASDGTGSLVAIATIPTATSYNGYYLAPPPFWTDFINCGETT